MEISNLKMWIFQFFRDEGVNKETSQNQFFYLQLNFVLSFYKIVIYGILFDGYSFSKTCWKRNYHK